ncbi:MAG: hypothetical protein Q4A72_04525 [Bacillota bacterium]|nr:hypothetical protein [Bacillota bacterium]
MKQLALVLALLLALSACSFEDEAKKMTENGRQDSAGSEAASGKDRDASDKQSKKEKPFVAKETKYAVDETTEVLLDAPTLAHSEIKSYYKHGDHWHVFTWDGREYITYKDPAKMSASEQNNLASVAKETEVYSPEQIVAHIEKVYEKNGAIILKWHHIDHYHDSIVGVSEDIGGVIVEAAPVGYLPDLSKEIPSFVKNTRYFRHGSKVYFLAGESQAEYKPTEPEKAKDQKKSEGDYEKYNAKKIVEHTEKIYEKNGLLIIKWLHFDHYHESAYGISDDIEGLKIEPAPIGFLIDASKEIPSTVKNKRFFRAGDKIYFLFDKNKKVVPEKQEEEKDKKVPKDGEKEKKDEREGAEENISGEDIVRGIENIYMKNGHLVIYWFHNVPGNPHHHTSIVGVSEDIKALRIVEATRAQVAFLEEIPSSVDGKKYYRGEGSDADTVFYVVLQSGSNDGSGNGGGSNGSGSDGGNGGNAGSSPQNPSKPALEAKENAQITLNGNLPQIGAGNLEFSAKEVSHQVQVPALVGKEHALYDFNLKNKLTGLTVQPSGAVVVSVPVQKAVRKVYHVSASGALEEKRIVKQDANSVSFETTHFSYYALVYGKPSVDAESDISGFEIVANIEKIYMKNGLLILKWLHKVPGHEHYHESAVGFSDDIKNVKFVENPVGYVPNAKDEIPSEVAGKKYYRGSGSKGDTIFVITQTAGLFDKVVDNGDQIEVVYKGKTYTIHPQEYKMALKENRFFPNEESEITIDTRFDKSRVITVAEDKLEDGLDFWAAWKREDFDTLTQSPDFGRFRWYILRKDANEYTEIEVDEEDSSEINASHYTLSKDDDGAILKVAVVNKQNEPIDEAKYLIKITLNAHTGEVSEKTKEIIQHTRKVLNRNGVLTVKWWHINHWHYEPAGWYGDLVIEKAPAGYRADNAKQIDELSLQDAFLNKIYYLEEDKIVFVEVDAAEFLRVKGEEILRRADRFQRETDEGKRVEYEYLEAEQKRDVTRFLELYGQLDEAEKPGLADLKARLEYLAGLSDKPSPVNKNPLPLEGAGAAEDAGANSAPGTVEAGSENKIPGGSAADDEAAPSNEAAADSANAPASSESNEPDAAGAAQADSLNAEALKPEEEDESALTDMNRYSVSYSTLLSLLVRK